MFGRYMAFTDYRYDLGVFGSPWAGLKNFEFLFRSTDLVRIVRNTVGYSLLFLASGLVTNVGVALLLYEINSKKFLKFYQTAMTLPRFLSWVIIGYITYAVLNPSIGVLNRFLGLVNIPPVDVYSTPDYWPAILTYVNIWSGVGMGCMLYYANLIGTDPALYEAATIDGAGRWQQTIHISMPALFPLMSMMSILAIGGLFNGDFGLFYQIPRNVGVLYPTTDIINTYVSRGLKNGDFGMSSATGLVQSAVGLVLIVTANGAVKKFAPDNSMF